MSNDREPTPPKQLLPWERDLLAALSNQSSVVSDQGRPPITDHCPPPAVASAKAGPITVVLGVGNRDRGDDGVGSVVAAELSRRQSADGSEKSVVSGKELPTTDCSLLTPHSSPATAVLDCGVAPENYLSRVAAMHPRHVVFIDAADFGAPPGSIRLFELGDQSSVIGDQ